MQIITTIRCHFSSIKIAINKNKNKQKTSVLGNVEKLELGCTASENVKWCKCYGK